MLHAPFASHVSSEGRHGSTILTSLLTKAMFTSESVAEYVISNGIVETTLLKFEGGRLDIATSIFLPKASVAVAPGSTKLEKIGTVRE